jgi:hypothetical protein
MEKELECAYEEAESNQERTALLNEWDAADDF